MVRVPLDDPLLELEDEVLEEEEDDDEEELEEEEELVVGTEVVAEEDDVEEIDDSDEEEEEVWDWVAVDWNEVVVVVVEWELKTTEPTTAAAITRMTITTIALAVLEIARLFLINKGN